MKQSGHLYPSEESGTGCHVTSKYGKTPPNKHGCAGRQQQQIGLPPPPHTQTMFTGVGRQQQPPDCVRFWIQHNKTVVTQV